MYIHVDLFSDMQRSKCRRFQVGLNDRKNMMMNNYLPKHPLFEPAKMGDLDDLGCAELATAITTVIILTTSLFFHNKFQANRKSYKNFKWAVLHSETLRISYQDYFVHLSGLVSSPFPWRALGPKSSRCPVWTVPCTSWHCWCSCTACWVLRCLRCLRPMASRGPSMQRCTAWRIHTTRAGPGCAWPFAPRCVAAPSKCRQGQQLQHLKKRTIYAKYWPNSILSRIVYWCILFRLRYIDDIVT